MEKTSIIILAAGFGTRMKSNKAKVLHKICEYPMLYHIIKAVYELSDDIQVVVAHQKEEIIKEISAYFKNITFVTQDIAKFPGTGGAVMAAKPKNQRVLILNGDSPLIQENEISELLSQNSDITLGIFKTQKPFGYGRVILKDDKVMQIVEEKDANTEQKLIDIVNSGVYLLKIEILNKALKNLDNNNSQKEYYLTDIIKFALANDYEVKPYLVDETNFTGINTKFHLSYAENLMQDKIKQNLMEQGVIMHNPNSIFIDPNAIFKNECEIYQNSSILGNCEIESSVILQNTIVENSQISNSQIGPFARIRPNSNIKNSKIGNFVEIKKSTLDGVKAGHLSYLGDALIDIGTNIGCGTITCNYDGKNKYQTKIGKNVFIGSDTQLIAPITIEDDVLVAAGTTLYQNVEKGSLAINRAPLKQIKDGFYNFFSKDKKC